MVVMWTIFITATVGDLFTCSENFLKTNQARLFFKTQIIELFSSTFSLGKIHSNNFCFSNKKNAKKKHFNIHFSGRTNISKA